MNKEFLKKIIKAERLKYEAIKEIMPVSMRKKVDDFEKEALNLIKDIAIETIQEMSKEQSEKTESCNEKTTKKVPVDFS